MVTSRLIIGLELFYCLDIVVNLPLGWIYLLSVASGIGDQAGIELN